MSVYKLSCRRRKSLVFKMTYCFFADFTKATDLTLENVKTVLGRVRNQRFSILVEDGKAVKVNIEPDGTGMTCSLANNLL